MASFLVSSKGAVIFSVEFPQSVQISKTPNWNSQEVIARWAPIFGFSCSNALEVSFSIRFSAEEGPIIPRVKFMLSLAYPDYSSDEYMPPPVILKIEELITLQGHVSNVQVSVPDEAAWGDDGAPQCVECSVTVVEDTLHLQSGIFS